MMTIADTKLDEQTAIALNEELTELVARLIRKKLVAPQAAQAIFTRTRGALGKIKGLVPLVRKGAEKGDIAAMAALGWCYVAGLGVKTNLVDGHMWLNIASTHSKSAAIAMAEATKSMSTKQITEARRRAVEKAAQLRQADSLRQQQR